MRRATLLCILLSVLPAPATALGQGGAADCAGPFQVGRTQSAGGLTLEARAYDITVQETGDLTCDQAREELREILSAPGSRLPEGWRVELNAPSFAREDGSNAFSLNPVVPA